MAMEMSFRVTATLKPSSSSPPSSSRCATRPSCCVSKPNSKPQFRPITYTSLPTSVSLFALLTAPRVANAISLPKEQIVSSITEVEKTIDQVQEVSSSIFDSVQHIFEIVSNTLKPGVDLALPILQQAGDQVVKISSPVISDASKQAQDAIQGAGFDMTPVIKTVVGAAQQTSKVVDVASPIASSTVETITSSDPVVIVGTAGALFVTYLILPPIWSVISYNFRGFKGTLTPAQTLDLVSTKNCILIDIRSETDSIVPAEVGMKEEISEDDRGHGFFGLNRFARESRWAQPITYIDIHECESFTMCIFYLPTSSIIHLHDHHGMSVYSKILYGSMHVKAFDWVDPRVQKSNKQEGSTEEN